MRCGTSIRSSLSAGVLCAATAGSHWRNRGITNRRAAGPGQRGSGYIGGVVQGPKGPEAGVWVIAETKDLPTNFIKIVVTDDQGRFMVPELPAASYSVWVRGYGLVDSTPVQMKPGAAQVTLRAAAAATPQEAAKVYPGNYWLSLMEPPAEDDVSRHRTQGNGVAPGMLTQNHWINSLKSGLQLLPSARESAHTQLDHVFKAKPELKTHAEAWEWRLGTGVRGNTMYAVAHDAGQGTISEGVLGLDRAHRERRSAAGAAAAERRRAQVVVTLWDLGDDHSFMHDEIATDKTSSDRERRRTVYAVSAGHGQLVDRSIRETNSTYAMDIPTRAPRAQVPSRFPAPKRPVAHWGNEHLWANPPYNPADPHNPMLDSKGRVWMTSKIRRNQDAAWCSDATNKFADVVPADDAAAARPRSTIPRRKQFTLIETCYATHHLQFDNDANETLYFNELTGPIFGWIDTKVYDQTKDEQKAVGWCGQVLDTNGDGRITRPWNVQVSRRGTNRSCTRAIRAGTGAGGARRPQRGRQRACRSEAGYDGQLQHVFRHPEPGRRHACGESARRIPAILVRLQRGNNPPSTCKTQIFKVPEPGLRSARRGHRHQRRRLDRAGREQPSGQLRRAQVQGPERSGERRTAASAGKAGRSIRRPVPS